MDSPDSPGTPPSDKSPPPTEAAEILRTTPPYGIPQAEPPSTEHLDQQLDKMVNRSRRSLSLLLASMAIVMLALVGAVAYLLVSQANASAQNTRQIIANQQASDHRWCATMSLLTSVPVAKPSDPKTTPAREAQYELYTDFVVLKRSFGCP
jgi:hypothetical protein